MEGVVIVNKEIAMDTSMDTSMDTGMDASMDATTNVTLKRKADDIGEDGIIPLLEQTLEFSGELENWEDTWDANWVREEFERITTTAAGILAAMKEKRDAKKAKNDSSTCTPPPLDTLKLAASVLSTAAELLAAMKEKRDDKKPKVEPSTCTTPPLDTPKLAASVVRIMGLARTTEGSLSGVPSVDPGVVKDLYITIKTCDKLLRALGVATPDGFEQYLERADAFKMEPHDLTTDEEIMETLVPIIPAVEIQIAETLVPIITATEITLAPEMSMTLLKNGKDTIVKGANDSVNNAYDVLFHGPKEMNDKHRIALRDIAADNLKILDIVGVPLRRSSAYYPYVDKAENAKEIISLCMLQQDARKMIVASAIQTIKDTVATLTNSCNLEPDVRQRLHNTVVNQKEILDNVGEPHPEGTEDFV